MSSRFFREALSMESETTVEAINPMEADLALESATVQITEASHEVEMLGYQQEELEHAHSSLESIAFSLESLVAADERGLDRVAAEGYQHAVRAIVGDALPNPVASLESFGGESECSAATQLSMEGIKDTIKKIWEAIKRAVSNTIKAVSDFFAKLFGGADALEKKVKSLKEGLAKAKSDKYTASNEKFKAPGADRLELNGKFDVPTVLKSSGMIAKQAIGTVEDIAETTDKFYSSLNDFYKKASEGDDAEKFSSDQATMIEQTVKKSKAVGEMLPGGKAIISESKSDSEGAPKVPTIKIADHPNAKNFSGDNEIAVPTLDQIGEMLDGAEEVVKWLKDAKKRRESIVKSRKDAVSAAESWVKDAEKGKFESKWTQAQVNLAMRLSNHDMMGNLSRIDGYVFSYTRGLVALADASLKQYGEKKEEK